MNSGNGFSDQVVKDDDHHVDNGTASSVTGLSKRDHVRNLAEKTKRKTRSILNLNDSPDHDSGSAGEEDDIFSDPAFNPMIALEAKSPDQHRDLGSTAKEKLKNVGTLVAHPRRLLRDKATKSAAGQMSKVQRSYLTDGQDHDLLAAHDDLADAKSGQPWPCEGRSYVDATAESQARKRIVQLEEGRESAKIAWAVGRHVQRVKVVQKMAGRPPKRQFSERDTVNGEQRFRWDLWLAKMALFHTQGFTAQYIDDFESPPFDMEDLGRVIERVSMASSPWQAWLLDVRRVYIWEDPWRTTKWLFLYCILWYYQHIMGFVYAYIIYITIRNRFYPDTTESVRKAFERSLDEESKAQAWGELVDKHGHEDWIEPLLDELGPVIQLQLSDLADYLEVVANFYAWVRPRKTAASLFFFTVCLLLTLVADMAFCIKLVWFVAGGYFFWTYPLATRFPQYRRLFSGWMWIFWDIPTDAEWSISRLQEKTLIRQREMLAKHETEKPRDQDSSSAPTFEYTTPGNSPTRPRPQTSTGRFHFRVYQGLNPGDLIIDQTSLIFHSKTSSSCWQIPFSHLLEMRKTGPTKTLKSRVLQVPVAAIEFLYLDAKGSEQCELLNVAEETRHAVFALVLGMGGRRWRALQIERANKAGGASKSHFDRLFKE